MTVTLYFYYITLCDTANRSDKCPQALYNMMLCVEMEYQSPIRLQRIKMKPWIIIANDTALNVQTHLEK